MQVNVNLINVGNIRFSKYLRLCWVLYMPGLRFIIKLRTRKFIIKN